MRDMMGCDSMAHPSCPRVRAHVRARACACSCACAMGDCAGLLMRNSVQARTWSGRRSCNPGIAKCLSVVGLRVIQSQDLQRSSKEFPTSTTIPCLKSGVVVHTSPGPPKEPRFGNRHGARWNTNKEKPERAEDQRGVDGPPSRSRDRCAGTV